MPVILDHRITPSLGASRHGVLGFSNREIGTVKSSQSLERTLPSNILGFLVVTQADLEDARRRCLG